MSIGRRLKKARINSKKSVSEITNSLGIHKSTLYRYEDDSIDISVGMIEKLAKVYNVNPTELVGWGIDGTQLEGYSVYRFIPLKPFKEGQLGGKVN